MQFSHQITHPDPRRPASTDQRASARGFQAACVRALVSHPTPRLAIEGGAGREPGRREQGLRDVTRGPRKGWTHCWDDLL